MQRFKTSRNDVIFAATLLRQEVTYKVLQRKIRIRDNCDGTQSL